MMNHLLRELAPISEVGWQAVEDEAKSRLTTYLAADGPRRLRRPGRSGRSATDLGRIQPLESLSKGVVAAQRRVLPLVEVRAAFQVSRAELDDAERGADDLDFEDLDRAAKSARPGREHGGLQRLPGRRDQGHRRGRAPGAPGL